MKDRFWRMVAMTLVALALVACGGITPAQSCVTAASAVVHGVDVGMKAAGDLYSQGKLTEAQKGKLIAVHDVYRPAAQAAVAACRSVNDQASSDKVIADLQLAASHVIEALVAAGGK